MKLIFPAFKKNIEQNQLLRPGDTVLVGFSGGKDSVALAVLLQELQKHLPFHLVAAYFNHGLRRDAGQEEKWVRAFCAAHGIELEVGSRDLSRFREENRLNLEHAASLSRYDFFAALAKKIPGARVATAHNRSDLSETFFIKLFRGSGLQGLSAIFQNKEKKIIRPLLIYSAADITAFLQRNRLEFYQDPTNLQDDFLRNRIRHNLMPAIEQIEPDIENRIFKTVLLIQDEFDYFQRQAQAILNNKLILGAVLPAKAFAGLHPAQARHLAREYLRRQKGNLLGVGFEHIADFLQSLETGRGLSLPGLNLKFAKGLIFPEKTRIGEYRLSINGEGRWPIPEIGRSLSLKKVSRFRLPATNSEIVVPSARLRFPLNLRPARSSDKYQKIHSPYRQSVFEMIRSSGVPAQLRRLCPLLENGDGEIIWVCGSPLAAAFAVEDAAPGPFFHIKITP
ncbi:MAG: tRNA lysidine(34) synthetase TilS [Candidatus Aminicenantes bacterium]|nr:tRNA lysidine(34) synthetase TilS [Acidobacteriota bacterium]MCG2809902.1 tRNA lysidine(34) synthetase TilS [Candidatus Aminicenantes bacterium]